MTNGNPDFRQHRNLRASFWIKLVFILVEVALAIGFAACNFCHAYNAAATLEWAIAFIFTFYVFSFFIDLLPAVYSKDSRREFGTRANETPMQMEENDQYAQQNAGRNTVDSQRTLGQNVVGTVNGVKHGNDNVASNF